MTELPAPPEPPNFWIRLDEAPVDSGRRWAEQLGEYVTELDGWARALLAAVEQ